MAGLTDAVPIAGVVTCDHVCCPPKVSPPSGFELLVSRDPPKPLWSGKVTDLGDGAMDVGLMILGKFCTPPTTPSASGFRPFAARVPSKAP